MGKQLFQEGVDYSTRSIFSSSLKVESNCNVIGVYLHDQAIFLYIDSALNETRRVIKYFFCPLTAGKEEYTDVSVFRRVAEEIKSHNDASGVSEQIIVDAPTLKIFLKHLDRFGPNFPSGWDIHEAFQLINQSVDLGFSQFGGYGMT